MKTLLWPERPKDKWFHHPVGGRKQPYSLWNPKQKEDLRRPSHDLALLRDLGSSSSTTPVWANYIIFICNYQYLSFQWVSIPKLSPLSRRRNLTCERALPGDPELLVSSSDVNFLFLSTPPACSRMLPYFRDSWLLSIFQKQSSSFSLPHFMTTWTILPLNWFKVSTLSLISQFTVLGPLWSSLSCSEKGSCGTLFPGQHTWFQARASLSESQHSSCTPSPPPEASAAFYSYKQK